MNFPEKMRLAGPHILAQVRGNLPQGLEKAEKTLDWEVEALKHLIVPDAELLAVIERFRMSVMKTLNRGGAADSEVVAALTAMTTALAHAKSSGNMG